MVRWDAGYRKAGVDGSVLGNDPVVRSGSQGGDPASKAGEEGSIPSPGAWRGIPESVESAVGCRFKS